jgi:hypothetical protein
MRKNMQVAIAALVLAVVAASAVFYNLYSKALNSLETAEQSERTTQDQYAQAISEIAEIQDSLATIMPEGEKLQGSTSYSREQALGGPNSQQILERIASVRAGLERGKARISQLESNLKASGVRVASLQKLVSGLRRSVQEKEDQLTSLSTQLAQVQDTLRVHDEMLVDRQRQLATVYFVAGPRRELMKSGVIEARGGVLGFGKTLKPSGSAPEALFSVLDTDMETVLPIDAKKAQVVSAQPLASYELRPTADGRVELHILDPAQFRKVRQLVIVTA